MGTAFYNCNNSDSAGAELEKHAALSNSQCQYKMWIFHCRSVKVNHNFLTSNYNKTKWKYLALYRKRGNMFNPTPKHTHTHLQTYIDELAHFLSALSVIVWELHIHNLSENHIEYFYPPPQHPFMALLHTDWQKHADF